MFGSYHNIRNCIGWQRQEGGEPCRYIMNSPWKRIGTYDLWAEKRPGISWQILDYSSCHFLSLQAAQLSYTPQQALTPVCCSVDFRGNSCFWGISPSHRFRDSEHIVIRSSLLGREPTSVPSLACPFLGQCTSTTDSTEWLLRVTAFTCHWLTTAWPGEPCWLPLIGGYKA